MLMAGNRQRLTKGEKKRIKASEHLHLLPEGIFITPQERGFAECPCTKKCTLHGDCRLCVAYHLRKRAIPRCER